VFSHIDLASTIERMADPLATIESTLRDAFAAVTGLDQADIDPTIRPSDHADAQANGALALSKKVGRNPRELAAEVVSMLDRSAIASFDVAGPGFINITFSDEFLASALGEVAIDDHLGVRPAVVSESVVVDYSAPNVAKEMHVGHLRSTVIGDALVRILEFVGHKIIRENHIGDWGTPFGMLIEHLIDLGADASTVIDNADPNAFYQAARARFDADDDFKARSRERVVKLQRFDPETIALWQQLVNTSTEYFNTVYRELGVLLTDHDLMGESRYQPLLPLVVKRLDELGLLEQSDGADVVFVPGFTNRDGDPLPLIVQKGHGGFNYATSDLACIIDRRERLNASLLVYVVGSTQSLHLSMVFKVAEMAGWLVPPARAIHVGFGSVLGADRKMFKTRSGENVKLQALIDEAIERGTNEARQKSPDLSPAEHASIGRMIGLGSIKYADLSTDRVKDYVFDWDRMLAFEGNTAPYLQYAHARINSIFRRSQSASLSGSQSVSLSGSQSDTGHAPLILRTPQEHALALRLLAFDTAVHDTADRYSPHRLCTYLFDLAQEFSAFYEACPVLKAADQLTVESRLQLCRITAAVLACGLGLLGIDVPERM
jgi:arginyl-tRNA synthetase